MEKSFVDHVCSYVRVIDETTGRGFERAKLLGKGWEVGGR